jgi:hypothetical protein
VRRFISATRYARIERTFATLVKRKGNGRDSGVTRRRERERRGEERETTRTPLPTHPRRSTPFVFTAPAARERGEAAPPPRPSPILANSPASSQATRIPNRLRLAAADGDAATTPCDQRSVGRASRVSWTRRRLGKGSPQGMDPEKRGYKFRILLLRLPVVFLFLDPLRRARGTTGRSVK